MNMAKFLVMAAGLAMASGSALAQRVDEDDLLGVWDCRMEGQTGPATLRVVFVEGGEYLSLLITGDENDPLPMWEVGEWEVDGDEVTFTPIASSEEELEVMSATIEDTGRGELVLSSDQTGTLEFESALDPIVGVWEGDTEEGKATFYMACGGGFAGAFGDADDDNQEEFWGRWEKGRRDEIVFAVTDGEWVAGEEPDFDEYEGEIGDVDEDVLSMAVEGLSDDQIEWERIAAHPLAGDWNGTVDDDMEVSLTINEDGTFEATISSEQETVEGLWTITGQTLVLAMLHEGEGEFEAFKFFLVGPDSFMLGEDAESMAEFTRQD